MADAAAWDDVWWDSAAPLKRRLWRGVEAQHVVATMRLVDSLDEQAVLEQVLEASKPALPGGAAGRHYLIATPFRYRSPYPSRFRRGGEAGIWYGAEELHTACAEVAHWRWRFLMDSEALRDGELLTEHTLFRAGASGVAIDLGASPWSRAASRWTHRDDYRDCQALAEAARRQGLDWIRYRSVRWSGGHCGAVLRPDALSQPEAASQQTWVAKVTRRRALMRHADDRFELDFEGG